MIAVGVDLGGTKTLTAAFDDGGACVASRVFATPSSAPPDAVLDAVADGVRTLEAGGMAVASIGVGFAGLVDERSGVVDSSVILPAFRGFPLRDRLADRLDRPVWVENDATAAGYGELLALGRPAGLDLVVLTVGTGIGGALILDGRLHRGASGTAGEFGNMTIDWEGAEHGCGNRGCLNTLASGTAIAAHAIRLAAERGGALAGRATVRLQDVAAAARTGDAVACAAIERGARALGAGIANLVMAFNPHRVALMGGVLALGVPYLDAVRAEARARSFARAFRAVAIEPCVLGELSGACGAAALAREAFAR